MSRRILFVDDDRDVLDGLRNGLRRCRKKWELTFAESGEDALGMMDEAPFDVVVSDMRMPRMDWAALLREVKARYPSTLRIVLSGHAEHETVMRAVVIAHQYLTKPCDAAQVESVIDGVLELRGMIGNDRLLRTVGRITRLPPAPAMYGRLIAMLGEERTTTDDVARVLSQDPAMSAKILQMVNSAFFRLSRRVTSVKEAVHYLGLNTVRQLALVVDVFGQDGGDGRIVDGMRRHGLLVGALAGSLLTGDACAGPLKQERENAFVAGLLHDVGKLVLLVKLTEQHHRIVERAAADGRGFWAAERDLDLPGHAEIGAYLLGLWGLPFPMVEAVVSHHSPERAAGRGMGTAAAVCFADALAGEVVPDVETGRLVRMDADAVAALGRLGLDGRLAAWRALAAEEAQRLEL